MCKPWKDERIGKRRPVVGGGKVDGGKIGRAGSAQKASVRRRLQPEPDWNDRG